MIESIFVYIGSYLQDGIQHRRPGELPEILKLSVSNLDYSTEQKHISITYNIDLLNNNELASHYSFVSIFQINDLEFENAFLTTINSETKVFDDYSSNILVAMIRFSFPFIRQMVQSMTNDIAGAVLLPLIDASALLQQGLEFQRETKEKSSKVIKKRKK